MNPTHPNTKFSSNSLLIQRERRWKLLFFLASLVLIFSVLFFVNNLMVSFILSLIIYYNIAPFVDFFERRGLSRWMATLIPFVLLSIVLLVGFVIFFPDLVEQVQTLQSNFGNYVQISNSFFERLESQIRDLTKNQYSFDLKTQIQPYVTVWAEKFFRDFPNLVTQSVTIGILVPFFCFFMLLDGRSFMRNLISIVPNHYFELVLNLNHQIGTQIGGFIQARIIESLIIGVFTWIGLWIIQFPYALILGLAAGILNIIPYLGPLLSFLPPLVIHFAGGGSKTQMMALISIFALAQIIDTIVLVPFLVAKIVNLHPVTVVLAILMGSQFFGIIGMIICIPLMSILKVTAQTIYRHFTSYHI